MKKAQIIFYIVLSAYIFIQTSFFPEPIANFLIKTFEPKLNQTTIISSPMIFVRYQNFVIHSGLLIAFLCVLQVIRISFRQFISDPSLKARSTYFTLKMVGFTFTYLIALSVINIVKGDIRGVFELSSDSFLVLTVFLLFPFYGFLKELKGRNRAGK